MSAPVFDLTPLTRGAASERRIIIKTFDFNRLNFQVALMALPVAALVASISMIVLGKYAVFVFVAVEFGVFWLVRGRSRKGLHLTNLQRLRDKRKAKDGFYIGDTPFNPDASTWERLLHYDSTPDP